MPPLHHRKEDPLATSDRDKARILAEKLIPASSEVDLSDIASTPAPTTTLDIPLGISPDQLEHTISRLPNGKATGPDGVPNEAIKLLATPEFLKDLVSAFTS